MLSKLAVWDEFISALRPGARFQSGEGSARGGSMNFPPLHGRHAWLTSKKKPLQEGASLQAYKALLGSTVCAMVGADAHRITIKARLSKEVG